MVFFSLDVIKIGMLLLFPCLSLLLQSKFPPPQRYRTRLVGGVRGGDENEGEKRLRLCFWTRRSAKKKKEVSRGEGGEREKKKNSSRKRKIIIIKIKNVSNKGRPRLLCFVLHLPARDIPPLRVSETDEQKEEAGNTDNRFFFLPEKG